MTTKEIEEISKRGKLVALRDAAVSELEDARDNLSGMFAAEESLCADDKIFVRQALDQAKATVALIEAIEEGL